MFGLVLASLRVSGSPDSIEIEVLHTHWISLSSFYMMIGMNLVSTVTLYFPRMTGLCILGIVIYYEVSNFLSELNTQLYADVYVLASSFLWYVNSDDLKLSFGPTLSLSSGITCTRSLDSSSGVGVLSFFIPRNKSS